MIKVTIQGSTTPEDKEFVVIAGGNCLFRGELSSELKASDIWAEVGRLLESYSKPGSSSESSQINVNQQMAAQWINEKEMYHRY